MKVPSIPTILVLFAHFSSGLLAASEGPYIDSLGFRAAQSRLDAVDTKSPDSLINQAFRVQKKQQPDSAGQPDFFKSIEDDYQRYLKLFTLHKRGQVSEVYCSYDLLETFRQEVFDPQPFLNAILHTLSLTDLTTLSFDELSRTSGRIIVRVAWSKAVPQKNSKGFSITEGTSEIKVTRNWISLIQPR
jgi:hypothetical protein